MEKIKLNFINESNDTNNSSIVIFQKNVAEDFGEIAVAWKVIENCGRLDNHPFTYPINHEVGVADADGNHLPSLNANEGQAYDVTKDSSGNVLQLSSVPATNATEVEVRNSLAQGAIDANCYRDGRLLATKADIAPGEKAAFEFKPTIHIGAASEVEEGDVMSSAIISQINTEINLFGITSADIVMRGGGSGPDATPFTFSLENINKN